MAKNLISGVDCAVKVIQKALVNEREILVTLMKQELQVLEDINHPYIVRVLDLCEDEYNYYIALELLPDGNLLEILTRLNEHNISFSERDAATLIYQVLVALNYMHKDNKIHRDLKMENIMV